jgi:hypothetical protein
VIGRGCNMQFRHDIQNFRQKKHGESRPCGRHRLKWEDNVKINAGEIGCDTVLNQCDAGY